MSPILGIGTCRPDGRVVFESERQREDQVEDIVDGQTGEVTVGGRRAHTAMGQNGDVDEVADDAERDDGWHDDLEDYETDVFEVL